MGAAILSLVRFLYRHTSSPHNGRSIMFYYLNNIYTTNFLPSDKFTRFSVVPISDGKKAISVPKPITIPASRDKNSIKTAAAANAKSRYRRRALDTAYWTEQTLDEQTIEFQPQRSGHGPRSSNPAAFCYIICFLFLTYRSRIPRTYPRLLNPDSKHAYFFLMKALPFSKSTSCSLIG